MPLPDIDPYWLIEHATVDELLALVHARDEVRALCTRPTVPVQADEGQRVDVDHQAGSTIPVRDDEVEFLTSSSAWRQGATERLRERSDTVVLGSRTSPRNDRVG